MKKVCSYKAYSIRFRRWSRKGYAVFMSLHKAVTIGHVCRSIADAALSKNKFFSTGNRKQVTAFADAGETEEAQDAGGGGIFASVSQVSVLDSENGICIGQSGFLSGALYTYI